ncbi:MAG: hypothetical protein WBO39_15090, partial [Ferruginibacter sp.]
SSSINQESKTHANIFDVNLEHHLISSGDNRPDINLYKDSVVYFLYALHSGIQPEAFAWQAGWSDSMLKSKIRLLQQSDFLPNTDGEKLLPTCMIVTQETGQLLFAQSETVANEIADSIKIFIPFLQKEYPKLSFSGKQGFDDFSFFILSNVLLDNWQINNVEKEFVKQARTARHGKNYFYQIAELNPGDSLEVFGIYGNQVLCNDTICVAVYGNRRGKLNLADYFGRTGLPFISPADEELFKEMANLFKPQLIAVFEKYRETFVAAYQKSVYKNEISFAEYFMWYYHFIYTRVTEILAKRGLLKIPEGGNFFYSGK